MIPQRRLAVSAAFALALAALPALALQAQQQSTQGKSGQSSQTTQQSQPAQQTQSGAATQAPAAGQPAAPPAPKIDPAEEKAYQAFYALKENPQVIITSGEAFIKQYPTSVYTGAVYARLASAYEMTNDTEKMLADGRQALKLDPNNVDVLAMLAYAIPRRVNGNDLDTNAKLQEAQQDAQRAIALLPTLKKPANMTDDDFAAAKAADEASCHSGLGLVDFYQHNTAGMVSELEQAVKIDPNHDPTNQFLLGLAYIEAGRLSDAVTPLTACSSSTSAIGPRCKSELDAVNKQIAAQPKPKQ